MLCSNDIECVQDIYFKHTNDHLNFKKIMYFSWINICLLSVCWIYLFKGHVVRDSNTPPGCEGWQYCPCNAAVQTQTRAWWTCTCNASFSFSFTYFFLLELKLLELKICLSAPLSVLIFLQATRQAFLISFLFSSAEGTGNSSNVFHPDGEDVQHHPHPRHWNRWAGLES